MMNAPDVSGPLFSHNSTQSCMEICTQCHQTLLHTAMQYCLPMGGKYLAPDHFRLMMNCAEMCQTTANFQLSDSTYCRQVSALTADMCDECATICEQMGDMEDCVLACRQCAQCCRSVSCLHS
ncbi:MAG: four-helix bundle copper-binding protein [Burkholderiaceae bacterium]